MNLPPLVAFRCRLGEARAGYSELSGSFLYQLMWNHPACKNAQRLVSALRSHDSVLGSAIRSCSTALRPVECSVRGHSLTLPARAQTIYEHLIPVRLRDLHTCLEHQGCHPHGTTLALKSAAASAASKEIHGITVSSPLQCALARVLIDARANCWRICCSMMGTSTLATSDTEGSTIVGR
jgi:hypothetical protein